MTGPSLEQIQAAQTALAGQVIETPVLPLTSARWDGLLPECKSVTLKLELFQQAGSFKARGALLGITLNHTAAHLVRAVMEGVALAMGRDVRLLRDNVVAYTGKIASLIEPKSSPENRAMPCMT